MKKIAIILALMGFVLASCGKSNESKEPAAAKDHKGTWSDGYVVMTITDNDVDIVLDSGGYTGRLKFSATMKAEGKISGTATIVTGYYSTDLGLNVGNTIYAAYSYNASTDKLSAQFATGNYPDSDSFDEYSRQ